MFIKILLSIIIIGIIYFIVIQITRTQTNKTTEHFTDHSNSIHLRNYKNKIPNKDRKENRYKRSEETNLDLSVEMIKQEYLDEDNSPDRLIDLVKKQYLDNQYQFNVANRPITTRYFMSPKVAKSNTYRDNDYLRIIRKDIRGWNGIMGKNKNIFLDDLCLISITETDDEFIIKINARIMYLKNTIHLRLTYYGQIIRSDDFLNGGHDEYILQLVDMEPISQREYSCEYHDKSKNSTNNDIFMTMDEQMEYVRSVHKMHADEVE